MSDYTFSTLNDQEFEVLARDLLNAKFGLELSSFKSGKDQGIDLRQSKAGKDDWIVAQVKHYCRSGIKPLLRTLEKEELPKVRKLEPKRYLVVTSVPLSPSEQKKIKTLFHPFVKTLRDVIGKEELNRFLGEFPHIEKQHFKLWFSSTSLISQILNNAVEGRTKSLVKQIEQRFPLIVVTRRLDDGNDLLEREKVLLITGQPGIGKTTLAQVLVFNRLKMGYQAYQIANPREAEDLLSADDDAKQLFYMDDFLGDIQMELFAGSQTSSDIARLVERIRNTPNKYLILTSRTIILQAAIQHFEKIRQSPIAEQRFELKLEDYSPLEKAQILYNHIYFSTLSHHQLNAFLDHKFYRQIIHHPNYAPRLIEFITSPNRIRSLAGPKLREFIEESLENPAEIWRDSFNNQIDYFSRCFLFTLFTFGGTANGEDLRVAFGARLEYEKAHNLQAIPHDVFRTCIKTLLDGFVSLERDETNETYRLLNPSLADFLDAELDEIPEENLAIANSFVSHLQLQRFEYAPRRPIEVQRVLLRRILDETIDLQRIIHPLMNYRIAIKLEWVSKVCEQLELDATFLENLKAVDFEDSSRGFRPVLDYVSEKRVEMPMSFEFVRSNFTAFAVGLISDTTDAIDAEEIPQLFESFESDFEVFSKTEEGDQALFDLLSTAATDAYEVWMDSRERDFMDIGDAEAHYEQLEEQYQNLKRVLFPNQYISISPEFIPTFDSNHWAKVVAENRERSIRPELESHFAPELSDLKNPNQEIDDLFKRFHTDGFIT